MRYSTLFVAALLLLPVQAQEKPTEQEDLSPSLIVPEGLEVTFWAKAPMFFNPTRMDCDERGRIWVSEAVNYRTFNKRPNALIHEAGDRIMILEDSDGDGKADSSKVFVQDKDLVAPLGVAVIGDKVVVSSAPHLIVFTRDMKTDAVLKKEILLTGFGGLDHDHSLHKLQAGPDGRWYFNTGNAGPHMVKDKSGWELRSGSWYTGGTPYNKTNTPGLKSDDGRVWHGGLILRVNPDGTGLTVLGHGHRNPYGTCIDSFGDMWGNDNDDTQSCRTTYLMTYGDLGYDSKDGSRAWQADKRPGQSIPTAHWRQEDPGVIPSGHVYGNGSPTGICYYEGGALGKEYEGGLLLSCEAGQNVVWGYRRKPDGAGFKLEAFPFVRSTTEQDPNYQWNKKEADHRKWFRPSDVIVGTDGAIYVCDWFDPIVGGHQMANTKGKGAIYRIAPKGSKPAYPKYDPTTVAGAIEMLKSPAVHVREIAAQQLAKTKYPDRDLADIAVTKLIAIGADKNTFLRARAVGVLGRMGHPDPGLFNGLMNDPDLAVAAYRTMIPWLDAAMRVKYAKNSAGHPSPAVRREVALSLRDVPFDQSRDILTTLARQYDGKDRTYLEALGTACEGKEEAAYAHLLGSIGSLPLTWSDAFADIAWRLHPVNSVFAHRDRALSPKISSERRKQAIDAIAFINDKLAATAMTEIATKGPEDHRPYAQWWLNHRATNDWKDHGIKPTTPPGAKPLALGTPVFESPKLRKGSVDIDVDITGASKLILIASDAGDGLSCDWADFIDPVLIGPGGQVKLTDVKWESGTTGYGNLNINKNCRDMPLKVGGVVYANGIGGHANLKLVYDIAGKNFTRFKAKAGVDDGDPELGGATYKGQNASIIFRVHLQRASNTGALRKTLLDDKAKPADREKAALTLAKSDDGGRVIIALLEEKKLPEALKAVIAEPITRNPDLSVRALADKHFPRKTAAGETYPSLDDLTKMPGDTARGKAVFFSKEATCINCHKIGAEGREVGPDLTAINEKYDKRTLLDSILNPSATILSGFETWLIDTEDGDSYTGFIVADGETVILKDTLGEQHRIPKKSITGKRQLELSIMPNNLVSGLKPQDLVDLVTYLGTKK